MENNRQEYICTEDRNGQKWFVDRRVVEMQPDGKAVLRDPVTGGAWSTDGTKLPNWWRWEDNFD